MVASDCPNHSSVGGWYLTWRNRSGNASTAKLTRKRSEKISASGWNLFLRPCRSSKKFAPSTPVRKGVAWRPRRNRRRPSRRGLPGPGLLAQVAVSKYGDHLPLNRMESIFQRHGVELSRKTMCGWMAACAELVSPVWEAALYVIDAPVSFHWEGTPMLFDRLWHSVSLLFPAVACLAAAAITARLQRSSGASPHAVPQSAP